MTKPKGSDKVHVIVTERPQRVWVVCCDQIHAAHWRTTEEGDNLRNVTGNAGLILAAMLAWSGQETFSLTFAELEQRSQGYGAWDE